MFLKRDTLKTYQINIKNKLVREGKRRMIPRAGLENLDNSEVGLK